MKKRMLQLLLGATAITVIAMSVAVVRPATTLAKGKATCRAYDRAEFALLPVSIASTAACSV